VNRVCPATVAGNLLPILPRANFGRLHEPTDGIIHGAGQSHHAFAAYESAVTDPALRPAMFMCYFGLSGLTAEAVRNRFAPYVPADPETPRRIAQIGLSMTTDGQPEKVYDHAVARGDHDDRIAALGEALAEYGAPVLLRIGYECSGPWNGYSPEPYRDAFCRITERLRAVAPNVATAWCVEGGWTQNCMPYYPGDPFVDWWSIDLFSPDHFQKTAEFVREADRHQRPVLIGECTPRRVGVMDTQTALNAWFIPFFAYISRHPNVKGISYINWDWQHYPQWSDWGNARIQDNPEVLEFWCRVLADPAFVHHPFVAPQAVAR